MTSAPRLLSYILVAFSFGQPAFAETAHVEEKTASTSIVAPAITVATISQATLRERIYASGTIEPTEQIAVAPQVEGQQIEELTADLGDFVEAGQVLAILADDSLVLQRMQLEASQISAAAVVAQAEASVAEAKSTAEEAVRVRDRAQSLKNEGTVSQAALDQAAAAATSALARATAAEQGLAAGRAQELLVAAQIQDIDLRIARTRIEAPVAGVITQRNAQIGAIASAAGQPMFVLIRDGLLELQAGVAEQDILKLAKGQVVALRPIGVETPLTGKVRLVEPTVDAVTRLGRVRIALDQPEKVRAGLFAEAAVLVAERTGLAAPVSSVATAKDGSASVLRVTPEGLVSLIPVTVGIRDGNLIEITSGLAEGDTIVARAGAFVRPGDTINPVPVGAAPIASN